MSIASTIPPIGGSVTVGVPVDQAFRVFTDSFNAWWPHQYHIGQSDVAEVILEPHEGGRWYERGVDGSECERAMIRSVHRGIQDPNRSAPPGMRDPEDVRRRLVVHPSRVRANAGLSWT